MLSEMKQTVQKRKKRAFRVRKTLKGTSLKPRLSVFKSNRHVSAQLIDDEQSRTLLGLSTQSKEIAGKKSKMSAREIGKKLATFALKQKIEHVVFDRGPYKYHGIIAEVAEGAREGGLKL